MTTLADSLFVQQHEAEQSLAGALIIDPLILDNLQLDVSMIRDELVREFLKNVFDKRDEIIRLETIDEKVEAISNIALNSNGSYTKWLPDRVDKDCQEIADEAVKLINDFEITRNTIERVAQLVTEIPSQPVDDTPPPTTLEEAVIGPSPPQEEDPEPLPEFQDDIQEGAPQIITPRRWTVAELLDTEFPEPRWAIPDIIPEGLTIFGGRPKVGKSWMMLQAAWSVGTGGIFFDRIVEQGNVLYLALEDNPIRLQRRLQDMGIPREAQITFMHNWRPLHREGGCK